MGNSRIYAAIRKCVCEIQAERTAANHHPTYALLIRDGIVEKLAPVCGKLEFFVALGEMVECGMVQTGKTLNDTYIRLL